MEDHVFTRSAIHDVCNAVLRDDECSRIHTLNHLQPLKLLSFVQLFRWLAYGILKFNHVLLPGNNRQALLLRGLFGSTSLVLYFITLQGHAACHGGDLAISVADLYRHHGNVHGERARAQSAVVLCRGLLRCVDGAGLRQPRGAVVPVSRTGSAIAAGLANMIRQLKQTEHPLIITFYFRWFPAYHVIADDRRRL